ncbi:MAG: DUF4215 domain-containing protein [Candidatus Peribacteraceae bacterium]|nr:DUF4215 domain-containing protein [Candidatus Peribacteraceae bacterium]
MRLSRFLTGFLLGAPLALTLIVAMLLVQLNPGIFRAQVGGDIGGCMPIITEYSVPTANSFLYNIANGPDGNVWFTETQGQKVGRVTPSGDVKEFSLHHQVSAPNGITVGGDENLWFAEVGANAIGMITPSGTVTDFPIPSNSVPYEVAKGPDDNVWFTVRGDVGKIGRITPLGVIKEFPLPSISGVSAQPREIAVGPDDKLWFSSAYGIGRITTQGMITDGYINFSQAGEVNGITRGSDGSMWVTLINNDWLMRIAPDGTITEINLADLINQNGVGFHVSASTIGPDGNVWLAGGSGNSFALGRYEVSTGNFDTMPVTVAMMRLIAGDDGNLWFATGNSVGKIALCEGSSGGGNEDGGICTDGVDNDDDEKTDWMRTDGSATVGNDLVHSVAVDSTAGYAYVGSSGQIDKVRLSDMTVVGTLPGADSSWFKIAAIDVPGGFAYFTTTDYSAASPARVIKLRLSDFTIAGSQILSDVLVTTSSAIDPTANTLYVVSGGGKLVKVRLSDLAITGTLDLQMASTDPSATVIDPAGGYVYVAGSPITRVRLSDFTLAGTMQPPTSRGFHAGAIDVDGGYAYFATEQYPGAMVAILARVRLSDFGQACELPLDAWGPLNGESGSGPVGSVLADSGNGMAYLVTSKAIGKVRLSDFSVAGKLETPQPPSAPGANYRVFGFGAEIDVENGNAYLGARKQVNGGSPVNELWRVNLGDSQCMNAADDNEGSHASAEPAYTCTNFSQSSSVSSAGSCTDGGSPSVTEYPLNKPASGPTMIARGSDNALWFTESQNNAIGRIDANGSITEFPIQTPNSNPHGIALGSDGNMWFTEIVGQKIGKITTAGAITEYALDPQSNPTEISKGLNNDLWFAAPQGNYIGRITTAGVITKFTLPSGMIAPSGIAVSSDGMVWFVFNSNGKVGRLDPATSQFTDFPATAGSLGSQIVAGGADAWYGIQDKIAHVTAAGAVTSFPFPGGGLVNALTFVPPNGNIWFAETTANKIGSMDTAGGNVKEYSIPTSNGFPVGIASLNDGSVWFTEQIGNKIGRIGCALSVSSSSAGSTCSNGGSPAITEYAFSPLRGGLGIAAGPDDNLWFTEPEKNRVSKMTPGGVFLREYELPVGSDPHEIITGPDGKLWLAEHGKNHISSLAVDGTVHDYMVGGYPVGLAVGADGNIWYGVNSREKIAKMTIPGSITEYPTIKEYSIGGQPRSIAAGPDGNIWFGLEENSVGKIGKITPNGIVKKFDAPAGIGAESITAGPDGNLWFIHHNRDFVGRITTDGVVSEYPIPTPDSHPQFIIAGPDGNLWFTEMKGNKIARVTTSGTITEYSIPTPQSGAYAITAGPDGNIWFTEREKFGKVTLCAVSSSSTSSKASSAGSSTSGTSSSAPGPDICSPICGDGLKVGPEECDDGNTKNGDGCSSDCRIVASSSSRSSSSPRCSSDVCNPGKFGADFCSSRGLGCQLDPGGTTCFTCTGEVYCKGDECAKGGSAWCAGLPAKETCSFNGTSPICFDCRKGGSSSSAPRCPADPCTPDAKNFCAQQSRTCVADAGSANCIRCEGDYACAGNECNLGGKEYCAGVDNNTCVSNTASQICIDCKKLCLGTECTRFGDEFCARSGKSCSFDPTSNECITCVPEPPLDCTGKNYCKEGGDGYCAELSGGTCSPAPDGICISCKRPGQCTGTNWECENGGQAYCSAVSNGVDSCTPKADGICIDCGGPDSPPYSCQGNECRKGGANYCGKQGLGCKNIPGGICINCAPGGCTSSLECAEGAMCVSGKCVQYCGNGRLDPGEVCDPSSGAGDGCTDTCLLKENQQCTHDTDCSSVACRKGLFVPCTTGGQCQSNDCRDGACTNLCGNDKIDPGEICDPGLAGSSDTCTRDCLRPTGAVCARGNECQTGLCEGEACTACERNSQCGSGLCVSGGCVDLCGNGKRDPPEQCDDGNRITGDGCSRFCLREATVAGELLPISLLGDVTQGGDLQGINADEQARDIAGTHAAAGDTGPAAVIAIAGGAAAGWSYMRRRRKK